MKLYIKSTLNHLVQENTQLDKLKGVVNDRVIMWADVVKNNQHTTKMEQNNKIEARKKE